MMTTYETEDDFLHASEDSELTPGELFFVTENDSLGFAKTASAYLLLTAYDQNVQFGQVNCSKLVCSGDVELNGVVKIDSEQVLP